MFASHRVSYTFILEGLIKSTKSSYFDEQKNFRICSHEALVQPGQRNGNCVV